MSGEFPGGTPEDHDFVTLEPGDAETSLTQTSSLERAPWVAHGPESPYEQREHLEDMLGTAVDELAEELQSSPDRLTRMIGEKLRLKLDFKNMITGMFDSVNDPTVYSQLKKFGIFVAYDTRAAFGYEHEEHGFAIERGDSIIDLHIPPVPRDMRSLGDVKDSLALLADFIGIHGLEPKYVMGVTYLRMAQLAHRQFGFNLSMPYPHELPEEVTNGIKRIHKEYVAKGGEANFVIPAIIWLKTEDFLDKFKHTEEDKA